MIKKLIYLFISVTAISCNPIEDKSRGIFVNEKMPDKIIERLVDLQLINQSDTVFGLFYHISNEPNNVVEDFTFFTSNKLLRYYQFGDKEPKIIETAINKILDIKKTIDPIDTNRILIKLKRLDTILINKREQKDDIFDEDLEFRPPYNSKIIDQEQFYLLLVKTWQSNVDYEELLNKYSRFYNNDGSEIITSGRQIERKKLDSLQNELKDLSFNLIDREDFIIIYLDNTIFLFSYDHIENEYSGFKIITEKKVDNDMDAMMIPIIYPIHKHGESKLPYTDRGLTIMSASKFNESSVDQILNKHFR